MPAVDCVWCPNAKWHATGRIVTSRRHRPRAEIECERCRRRFLSGAPAALDAAAAERGDCEVTPEAPRAPVIPRPSLPMSGPGKRPPSFVTTTELAKHSQYARFVDRKRAAAGDE